MFSGARVKLAVESTLGGLIRARQQHGMPIPDQAFATLLRNNQHTCKHIMRNRRCTAFEAVARTCAVLYWALKEAEMKVNFSGGNPLAKDFEDAIVMALSKDGEAGAGSRGGVWQPMSIAKEILAEMKGLYGDTVTELSTMFAHAMEPTNPPIGEQSTSERGSVLYRKAIQKAAARFNWEESDLEGISEEAAGWELQQAVDLAEAFSIDGLDHPPWELNPMFQAGMYLARVKALENLRDEMRDELRSENDNGGESLRDLSVIHLMFLETHNGNLMGKYLELAETVSELTGLEWEESLVGNLHFFANNLEKLGITDEAIREQTIALVRKFGHEQSAA